MTCECGCGAQTARTRQREGAYAAGEYRRFVRGHYRRLWATKGYPEAARQENGRRIQVHRLRAEKALGKPLPPGAVVHHADGSIRADAPLVICPDEGYHRLLHIRMRIKARGGDPNSEAICCFCQRVLPRAKFVKASYRVNGVYGACKECRITRRQALNA